MPTHPIEPDSLNKTESSQSLKEGLAGWSIRNQVPKKKIIRLTQAFEITWAR